VPAVASGARLRDLSPAFIHPAPFVRLEILMVKPAKSAVFWDVTSCSLVEKYGLRAVTLCVRERASVNTSQMEVKQL
jgi:hypothetical protein